MSATFATHYGQYPDDALTKSAIRQATKLHAQYVVYNREREGWEFHNDQTMLAPQHDQARKENLGDSPMS